MTEAQRRYMHARQRFTEKHLIPANELLAASSALVEEWQRKAERAEQALEKLRPVWAQGFTSDSRAATANGDALAEIWKKLGVANQTAAMLRLNDLLGAH